VPYGQFVKVRRQAPASVHAPVSKVIFPVNNNQ
jgi:hypothetical protein